MAKVVKSDEPITTGANAGQVRNDQIRETVSKILRVIFLFFAVVLALGAFLIAARDNVSQTNEVVKFIKGFADAVDGPFSRDDGIFKFTGENAETKDAVVNWGIAAIVYLAIGRYVQHLLAPRKRR